MEHRWEHRVFTSTFWEAVSAVVMSREDGGGEEVGQGGGSHRVGRQGKDPLLTLCNEGKGQVYCMWGRQQ